MRSVFARERGWIPARHERLGKGCRLGNAPCEEAETRVLGMRFCLEPRERVLVLADLLLIPRH